jgi:hypothetical protein
MISSPCCNAPFTPDLGGGCGFICDKCKKEYRLQELMDLGILTEDDATTCPIQLNSLEDLYD